MFIVCELELPLISSSWSNYKQSYNNRSRAGLVVLHHWQLHSSNGIDEQEANVAVYLNPFCGSSVGQSLIRLLSLAYSISLNYLYTVTRHKGDAGKDDATLGAKVPRRSKSQGCTRTAIYAECPPSPDPHPVYLDCDKTESTRSFLVFRSFGARTSWVAAQHDLQTSFSSSVLINC